MRDSTRRLQLLVLVAVPVLTGISSLRFLADVGRPFEGMITYNNVIKGNYEFSDTTPSWWTLVDDAILPTRIGLYEADGSPYADAPTTFARLWDAGERKVTLRHDRIDGRTRTTVPLVTFTIYNYIDLRLPTLILAFTLWLIALLIYRARSTDPLSDAIIFNVGLASLSFGIEQPSLFWLEGDLSRVLNLLGYGATAAVSLALAFIGCSFFTPRWRWLRRATLTLFALWALAGVGLWLRARLLFFSEGATGLARAADNSAFFTLNWLLSISSFFLIFCLIGVLIFIRPTVNSFRTRRAAAALLLGFILAQPSTLLNFANRLLDQRADLFFQTLDLRYLLLFIPFFAMAAIVRYQSFGTRSPGLIVVMLLIASALGASLLNSFFLLLVSGASEHNNYPTLFAPSFLVLFVMSAFWSFQSSIQGSLGRLFHRRRRNYQDMQRFLDLLLTQGVGARDPGATIGALLREQFNLTYVGLWLGNPNARPGAPIRFTLEQRAASAVPPSVSVWSITPTDWGTLLRQPIFLTGLQTLALPDALARFRDDPEVEAVLPLSFMSHPIGLLAVGGRRDHDLLGEQEVEVLIQMAQQIMLFLEMNRRSEALDRTRDRLHDTTQQSLTWLMHQLNELTTELPPLTERRVIAWIDYLTEQNHIVEDLQRGVYQRYLADLPRLLYDFSVRHQIAIDDALDLKLHLPDDLHDEIYHWVFEALNNVWKYAHARRIHVSLARHGQRLRLIIHDDGIGIPADDEDRRQGGLTTIEKRVLRRGGIFTVSAMPYGGTRLFIDLPIQASAARAGG